MVDQEATKDEASDGTCGETTNERKVAQGNKTFRKKVLRVIMKARDTKEFLTY